MQQSVKNKEFAPGDNTPGAKHNYPKIIIVFLFNNPCTTTHVNQKNIKIFILSP